MNEIITKNIKRFNVIKNELRAGTKSIDDIFINYDIRYFKRGAYTTVYILISKQPDDEIFVLTLSSRHEPTSDEDQKQRIFSDTKIEDFVLSSCNEILKKEGTPHLIPIYVNILIPNNHKYHNHFNAKHHIKDGKNGIILRVLGYSPGIQLDKFIRTSSTQEELIIIQWQVLYTLAALMEQNPGFTHNDLHEKNVLIERKKEKTTVAYNFNNKQIKIHTDLDIKVIDFDFAFTADAMNKKIIDFDLNIPYDWLKSGLSQDNTILYSVVMFLFVLTNSKIISVFLQGIFKNVFGDDGLFLLANCEYPGRMIDTLMNKVNKRLLYQTFYPTNYLLILIETFPHIFHSNN